ncbi:DUF6314 family protein [Marivita sp. GX14005]|uniref:DUF6314 family protein n=1 Tax=Marivita sp. GX14005 TaxID=2942276 RepID=UPI002019A1DE|nr:DUF6314 family protein [Marivita sp. GX14005]MCL3882581.1 DUF6314 family protein [Marivita sp. GX14005]
MTIADLPSLRDFEGSWAVSRVILDRTAGPCRFDGTAQFSSTSFGLHYSEAGRLYLPDHAPIRAERQYLWQSCGNRIEVKFSNGAAFHTFDPADPRAAHFCDPDSYSVTYHFENWPIWRSTWIVRGPRKSYRMVTTYRPDAS